ncbi:protein kinase [Micromonospora sp. PLK6-60]|uniref:protein kinase domain-containing protein n=1 Tax=Micromonospora sp. PLK6-60 TaxID=2873383 RepID=UPI001CA60893|nr:protein kinase [Micromonospora sp. PLK6-60]MBY8873543.1 protein kinase [Micromonospora sp. PLK6-60]
MSRLLDGRYQAEELLGSGGMAAVWRGRDLRLDRPVAVKVLTGAGLDEPMALERFDREARAVARLAHPNIVAVYDFGTDDGDPYLVMELVEGQTVSALVMAAPLPIGRALAIAEQTCDGLAAAHAAGVVHRDIKPGNLIVTPAGIVKICDFGIARLSRDGENTLTNAATRLGTSSYMSPEQATGGPVDPRTDLYGLGCTLYTMLAGTPPFAGDPLHVLHQHLHDPPTPVRSRRPEVPPALDALLADLLAKDPAARPTDAAEVRDRLAAIRADLPGDEATDGLPVAADGPPLAALAGAVAAGPARPDGAGSAPVAGAAPWPTDGSRPSLDRPTDEPRRRSRRPAVLLAVLAGAVVLAVAGAALLPDDEPTSPPPVTAATTPATRPAPVPSSAAASTPPAPSPTSAAPAPAPRASTSTRPVTRSTAPTSAPARTTSPPPPADPIVAIRLSIQEQVNTGQLNPDAAKDLHAKVDAVAKNLAADDQRRARDEIKKLREKLTGLRKDGRLSEAGYLRLSKDVDRLAAQVG